MKNAWEGWQLAILGHLGENAISKSHPHCLLSEEEKTNPNLFTCLPQTWVAGTTEVLWKRRHAPEVWASHPSATPRASHDRNVPPTNRGGFTFKPLCTIKAHPSSPKYVQSWRRVYINHTQRPLPWLLLGQSKPGGLHHTEATAFRGLSWTQTPSILLAARQRKWQPAPSVRGKQEEEQSKSNSINAHFLKAGRPVSLPVS